VPKSKSVNYRKYSELSPETVDKMADIFYPKDVAKLLSGKRIAYIGDSVMRSLYKDLVWLLNDATLTPQKLLGTKGEKNFPDVKNFCVGRKGGPPDRRLNEVFHENNVDDLMSDYSGVTARRTYIERREYYNEEHDLRITSRFITRVWSEALEKWLKSYVEKHGKWDIIVFNSCLWDVLRWGPFGIAEYKQNLSKFLELIPKILAPNGNFIWMTTPPCAEEIKSPGMNVPVMAYKYYSTRFMVIEANTFTAQKVSEAGFNVLDMHYYLQMQTFRRNRDGIHWSPEANRLMTNMTLTHISLAKSETLPQRVKFNYSLEMAKLQVKSDMQGGDSEEIREKRKQHLELAKRLSANRLDKQGQQEIKKQIEWMKNNPEEQQSSEEEDKYSDEMEDEDSDEDEDENKEDSDSDEDEDENNLSWWTYNIWDKTPKYEDEDKDSDGVTIVAAINKKDEETDLEEWRNELIKLTSEKEIKQKYYDRAVIVWKKGTDFPIPKISEVHKPRLFRKNGKLVDFETPDEFIDNNHPAWKENEDLNTQKEVVKAIHKKWGSSNKIDLTRNLTSFPNETPNLSQENVQETKANGRSTSFNDESVAKLRKVDYIEKVSAASLSRSGGLEQTAEILESVEEVFKFNQMYNQGNDDELWLTEEQDQEFNSLEDLYHKFEVEYPDIYPSKHSNGSSKSLKTRKRKNKRQL